MKTVKHVILEKLAEGVLSKQDAMEALEALTDSNGAVAPEIAVIGMSCRLPMSPDVGSYWDNLVGNRNCYTAKPADKLLEEQIFANPHYAEFYDHEVYTEASEDLERFVGAYLSDIDKFDAQFFGITPDEAAFMDPQHRVFLEQAYRALEDAGYPEDKIRGSKTGCFVGRDGTNSNYYRYKIRIDRDKLSGVWEGIVASRINYHFDLRGPSYVVDTACSASLVAMHMAIQALSNGECEMAIAGGITLSYKGADTDRIDIDDLMVRTATPGAVVAHDNRVRSFDAKASGSVFGEGIGALILKPLKAAERDGDHIYGVIASTATNNDGASNGLTAPNPRAQEELLLDAWRRAGIEGEQVDYVETHGTGTPLGDPIEVLGLTNAFGQVTPRKQFCGIGSVKSNIGHTVGSAGVASVIKVLLSMRNEVIPASLNFEEPNPHIDFANSPIYVVDRNTPWPQRETPRYAGVSGFGFSGTNAHVILKDYRAADRPEAQARPQIFTVSAKTETAFANYLADYDRHLNGGPGARFDDVCFTSTTGRDHFAHRLAIVASSMSELVAKFNACRDAAWTGNPSRGIFVGSHRVVSDRKSDLARGDIKEGLLGELNLDSAERVKAALDAEGSSRTMAMTELARDYVRGARIRFDELYDRDARRVPLPTYPFDRTRHWGEPRTTRLEPERAVAAGSPVARPLITRRVVDTPAVSVYEASLSTREHWAVSDHVVMNKNLIAGAVFVELITEAFCTHFDTDRIAVDELMFRAPLLLDDATDATVQIILREDGDRVAVEVVSRTEPGEDEWVVNAHGFVRTCDAEAPTGNPTLAELLEDPDLERLGVPSLKQFGPTWRTLGLALRSKSDPEVAYGLLELPEEFHDQIGTFPLHPSLLDNATSFIPFLVHMSPTVYLPMLYAGLRMYRPLPAKFYCKSERTSGRRSELMSFKTTLVAEDGSTIAVIDQFSMKRVSQMDDFVSGAYHAIGWREGGPLPVSAEPRRGPVLVVGDRGPQIEAIVAALPGVDTFALTFAPERSTPSARHVMAEPTAEGVTWALAELGVGDIARVVDLTGCRPSRTGVTEAEISQGLEYGVRGLAALHKALTTHCKGHVDITVVGDHADRVTGDEPFVDAAHAARLAMIRSLRHEAPNVTFTAVDVDAETPVAALVDECLTDVPGRVFVALRKGVRHVPQLEERTIDRGSYHAIDVAADGFYLVTGGAGSLGSAAAALLSHMNSRGNYVLVSRRPLPDRSEWDQIIAAGRNDKVAQVLENILDIEDYDGVVELACADVTDHGQLRDLVERMRAKFGPIRGIVHTAGVAGDGFLYTKSMDDFDGVLAPKVTGLRNLISVLGEDRPDFVIAYSSMTALIGGPGQSDYTAANAFMDAYVLELRRQGHNAKSINWPGWRETGMAYDHGLGEADSFFESLTTQSGISAFTEVLFHDVTGVVPGPLNAGMFQAVGEEWFPFGFSGPIDRIVRRHASAASDASAGEGGARPAVDVENIALLGKPAEEFTEIERTVAYIYASVLGLEEIDIFDSFTALGGNSITATEVMKALNARFDDVLNISDMFTYATPDEMAVRLSELAGPVEQAAPAAAEPERSYEDMLTKLESGDIDADSMISFLANEKH
ncbi:SDR family NAD(P)-dependent oxidoreductase [Phytomonospora sp. NPDC050363]|uniref:SDR family NAD(P)-dependent oxidoreductase n=1 Tax=Phytomonospora sp. NPDC050363 TaxID=3155642 RepID=UPI0033F5D551